MHSRRTRILLAILSGLLLGLAFPPTGLAGGLLAFVGLVPLLFALHTTTRLREAFWTSWLAMFVLGLISNYWVGGWKSLSEVDPFLMVGGVLLALVHPFFLVVPWLLYDVVRRRVGSTTDRGRSMALYSLPLFYAGFEYAHSFGDLSYPWLSLYNTQSYNLAYIQFLEWTGPYALTMAIVLVNVELFQIYRYGVTSRKAMPHLIALICLIGVPYVYGTMALGGSGDRLKPVPPTLRVTVVQPNIDPWAKWGADYQRTLDTNFSASVHAIQAVHDSTDLLLWPETAITFYITSPGKTYEMSELYGFLSQVHHPLLTGFPDRQDYLRGKDSIPPDATAGQVEGVYFRSWNAAMLIYQNASGNFMRPVYHKQKLVPLGEHVPFVQYFPFLGKWFAWGVGLGSWNYGEGYEPIKMPLPSSDSLRIIPLICYESVYPSFVRHFVDHGANLLAVITNDGWYGRSSGPYQHEQFAVLRAIENRRWVVRSANTGVSCVIDDRGRYVKELPLFTSGSITERVPLLKAKTLYVRWGDYIAIPALIYSIVALLFGVWMRFGPTRRSRAAPSSAPVS
jgi:apolipoprotein N-acyltransferase